MSEIEELRKLMNRADSVGWGPECADLWAQAARLAEQLGREDDEVTCYVELTVARAQTRRYSSAVAPFLWCESKIQARPDLFDDYLREQHAWNFKYIVGAVMRNPAVSVKQCFDIVDRMKQFYQQIGDSGRAAVQRSYLMNDACGDLDQAEKDFIAWQSLERTELADCFTCEPEYLVDWQVRRSEWDKAVRLGEQALSVPVSQHANCGDQPEALKAMLLESWVRTGHDDKAFSAHIKAWRKHRREASQLVYHHFHLRYLALTGPYRPERLDKGKKMIVRYLPWWSDAPSHWHLMQLCAAAGLLLSRFPEDKRDEPFGLSLGPQFERWQITTPSVADPTNSQAAGYFTAVALELAGRFDARPGMTVARHVRRMKHYLGPDPIPALPDKGPVPDATGIAADADIDYRIGSAGGSSSSHLGVAKTDDESVDDSSDYVTISLTGPWQAMSCDDLLVAAEEFGAMPSIYALCAMEYLAANPRLVVDDDNEAVVANNDPNTGDCPRGDDDPLGAWDYVYSMAARLSGVGRRDGASDGGSHPLLLAAPRAGRHADHAYELLHAGWLQIEAGRLVEGCQLVDDALREHSVEPIGVRLFGLMLLAHGAIHAGYPKEAVASARQVLNLAVAYRLTFVALTAAELLVTALHELKREQEAAEVAEAALLRAEHLDDCPLVKTLHEDLYRIFADDSLFPEACEQARWLATHAQRHSHPETATAWLSKAIDAAIDAEQSAQARAIASHALALTRARLKQPECDLIAAAGSGDITDDTSIVTIEEHILHLKEQELLFLIRDMDGLVCKAQPLSDEELSVVSDRFDEARSIVTDPACRSFAGANSRLAESNLRRRFGIIYMRGGHPIVAMEEESLAADGFEAEHDYTSAADAMLIAGAAADSCGENARGTEWAQRAVDLLEAHNLTSTGVYRLAKDRLDNG